MYLNKNQKWFALIAIFAVAGYYFGVFGMLGDFWSGMTGGEEPTTAQIMAAMNDGVCQSWEIGTGATDCAQPSGGETPVTPYMGEQIVCNTPDFIVHKTYVDDSLDEEGPTYLATTVKLYLDQGNGYVEVDRGTSSASAALDMNVPCDSSAKSGYMVATDDDDSGNDIYPVQKALDPFKKQGDVLVGPASVPFHLYAKIQGVLAITAYDTTGVQTDTNITWTTGSSSCDIRLKISQTTNDAAAQGVWLLMNYNSSAFQAGSELEGITAGCGAQLAPCPPGLDNASHTWDKCWRLTRNGAALTLDEDTRTDDPSEVYYKMCTYAQSSVNPTNDLLDYRVVDSMPFEVAGSTHTWFDDCSPLTNGLCFSAEDDDLSNLGIQAANEPTATITAN
jgi:hypothetical protein